jgi:Arf-GAP with SH3 domain, ANK repeat and PH domain-containing protein
MGNVSSRPDDGAALYLRDQNRRKHPWAYKGVWVILFGSDVSISAVSLASLSITNSRRRMLLNVVPNSFPSTRIIAKRETGDDNVVEYVQVGFRPGLPFTVRV